MSRIVALDVGDATIGVAATDELRLAAHPVTVIRRGASVKADLRAVESLLAELDAAEVVVGIPLDADGGEGPQAAKVREFAQRLARRVRVPLTMWDERYSTAEAEQLLLERDVSRAKRRSRIDATAAAVILQEYLQSTRPGPETTGG